MSPEAATAACDAERLSAEEVVASLARAMKNTSFYDVAHPVVADVVKQVVADVTDLLKARGELVIKFMSGFAVVREAPILSEHASVGNLLGACHRREIESIVLLRGVREREVAHLVEVLATDPAELKAAGGAIQALAAQGVRRVVIEKLVSGEKRDTSREGFSEWRWVYTSALDVLRGVVAEVRTGRPLDVESVRFGVRELVDDVLGENAILHNLNSMKDKDEYTFIHALHICVLALELGRGLGLAREQLEELGIATLLHDVGKIFVPLDILRKPVQLGEDEFAVMSRHPLDGAVALAREPELPPVAAVVALEHHMHLDHSGYPQMRRPRPLNMYSLMASIADVYDALTTMRPYRPQLPPHQAVAVMREQFVGRLEPRLLARFLEVLGPYPWGTVVRVDERRLAVVTRPNAAARENPFARVIELGYGLPRAHEEEVPLWELLGETSRVEVVDPVALGINLTAVLHGAGVANGAHAAGGGAL